MINEHDRITTRLQNQQQSVLFLKTHLVSEACNHILQVMKSWVVSAWEQDYDISPQDKAKSWVVSAWEQDYDISPQHKAKS